MQKVAEAGGTGYDHLVQRLVSRRRAVIMAIATATDLLAALRQYQLLQRLGPGHHRNEASCRRWGAVRVLDAEECQSFPSLGS